ncbi:unnamed protein product, partial [Rotaria socialis]
PFRVREASFDGVASNILYNNPSIFNTSLIYTCGQFLDKAPAKHYWSLLLDPLYILQYHRLHCLL